MKADYLCKENKGTGAPGSRATRTMATGEKQHIDVINLDL